MNNKAFGNILPNSQKIFDTSARSSDSSNRVIEAINNSSYSTMEFAFTKKKKSIFFLLYISI